MTDIPARDFEPPAHLTVALPPWELQVGNDLEDVYCAYTEWPVIITRGFPPVVLDRMRDMGGWSADRLRAIRVDPALLDRFEELLNALPGQDDFPRELDLDWVSSRRRMSEEVEHLLGVARAAIGIHRRRYYDYGVMLRRVRLCASMLSSAAQYPVNLATFPDLIAHYRQELSRTTEVLVAMVVSEDPTRPRDPEQWNLERGFAAFAEYLVSWRTGGADLDDEFHERLKQTNIVAGFRSSDASKHDFMWHKHREPLPEEELMLLPVPHSVEDREQLEERLAAIRSIAASGEFERALGLLRQLRDVCRHVLGPVHPLTLHVQVDFAATHCVVDRAGTAILMLFDVATTALHYYGPHHPTRYLIIAHAHSYLLGLAPDGAQELYNFPLKSLVTSGDTGLSPELRRARHTIRAALGMHACERVAHPDRRGTEPWHSRAGTGNSSE
jgi:hypothetical protein